MLNAKDISFRRVVKICEILGLTPGQLFTLSEKSAIPEIQLTKDQEDTLIKNRALLSVYWRFVIEKRQPSEIEKLEQLSPAEVRKLLSQLVSLKLVKLVRGQYRSLVSGKFRWSDDSKLARFLNKEWSELTLKRALALKNNSQADHRLSAVRLTKKTYTETLKKLSEVLNEAVQASEREEVSIRSEELQNCTFLYAAVPLGVFDSDIKNSKS